MLQDFRRFAIDTLGQIIDLDAEIILFAILMVVIIILYDSFHLIFAKKSKATGIQKHTVTFGLEGSETAPVKDYISDLQGLAGRPDAVIIENGFAIPVERKPLSKKIRDRHVAQLLVYMRLIEEFHGKRPPYGYLILGANCRRVKITNSIKKQEWLQQIINEMKGILHGAAAKPLPTAEKCAKCDVREHCKAAFSQISPKNKTGSPSSRETKPD